MRRSAANSSRAVLIAAACCAGLCVVVAARSRTFRLVGQHAVGSLRAPAPTYVATLTAPARPTASAHVVHTSSSGGSPLLGRIVLGVLIALAVVVVALLVRAAVRAARGRAPVEPQAEPADGRMAAQLDRAVEQGLAHLERLPVADAIIACWQDLQALAEQSGLPVSANQTPAELVAQALPYAHAPSLTRLASLYREARFSPHAMDEAARDDARRCLETIRLSLRASDAAR